MPGGGGHSDPRSSHPVDALIRELASGTRRATTDDRRLIQERMLTVDFVSAESLGQHALTRFLEEQWAQFSEEDYLRDLRRGVEFATRIGVYVRRGGAMAIALANTEDVVPDPGHARQPLLVVIYSTDRGAILSGYMASSLDAVSLPEVLWLP